MNKLKINIKGFIETNKKLAILLLVIASLGIIFFFVRLLFFNKKVDESLEIIFNQSKMVAYLNDDLYGYMDIKGNVLIEAKYQEAGEFFNGYAYIKLEDKHYQIIDTKGDVKLDVKTDITPTYIRDYRVWLIDNKIYNDELGVIFEGNYHTNYINYGYFEFMDNSSNASGIVDYTGRVVYKWNQDYIHAKISKNEYKKYGYYALVSNYEEEEKIISLDNGKELYTLEDPSNTYIREEENNIFRIIDRGDSFKTKKWLYLKNNKIVFTKEESIYSMSLVKHEADILEIDYGPTFKSQKRESQYAYFNVDDNKEATKPDSLIDEKIEDEIYGYHIVKCDKLFGINKSSREIAKCDYDEVKYLESNLYNYIKSKNKEHIVVLKKGSDSILYNMRKKRPIETFENASVALNTSSTFITVTQYEEDGFTKKSVLVYNLLTHKYATFDKDTEIVVNSNYFVANNKYYNTNLDMIYE